MAAHSRLPRVGDTFGRYRIDAQIGRGGMGVVYSATDTTIERTVALKVVASALGDSEEFRLRFEREAAVLARLASPHVIDIYDYGTEDGCPYIATQYVGGGDLGALLSSRGPMPPTLALRVCAQMADALDDAHRVGVVHRDVKPTNVLLRADEGSGTTEPYAYLCDFGIARTATDGLTAPGAIAGTWSYLAPECGRGAAATPASDIYALGCLLWATLTGRPPFHGTDVEIAVAHQQAPLPRLEGDDELSTRINQILERSMAKRPQDRYVDADEFRRDLTEAAALTDSGIRPAPMLPVPPGGQGGPSSGSYQPLSFGSLPRALSGSTAGSRAVTGASARRRGRTVVALVAVAVVLVIGGVVAITTLGGGDDPQPSTAGTSDPATSDATDVPSSDDPGPTTDTPAVPGPRVDQGGPITGDRNGDGFGDLVVRYDRYRSSNDDRTAGTFVDTTSWTSTGSAFDLGETQQLDAEPDPSDDTVLGDFDGDDIADELTLTAVDPDKSGESDKSGNEIRVVAELSGGGSIDDTVSAASGTVEYGVTDLDGDGTDDLVLETFAAPDSGPATFTGVQVHDAALDAPVQLLQTEAPPGSVLFEAGDFDGDELGDLAVLIRRDTDTGYTFELTLWLGDGTGGTTSGPSTTLSDYFAPQMVAADVDGDEDKELVVIGDISDTTLDVLDVRDGELTGPTRFGQFPSSSKTLVTGVSDVNGDGLDDIVAVSVRRRSSAKILVARADATGPFAVSTWTNWDKEFTKYGYLYSLSIEGGNF